MRYKINKGFIIQKVGVKTTIFDGEKSTLYTFNETASYVFPKIKAGWEEKKIVQAIVKRYKIKEKDAKNDLRWLFLDLKKKKILQIVSVKPKAKNKLLGG